MLMNIHSWPLLKAFLGVQATFHLMGKPDGWAEDDQGACAVKS